MKKIFTVLSLILIFSFLFSFFAEAKCINFYCLRNKNHKQPTVDFSEKILSENSSFYVDKNHSDDNEEKIIYLTFDAGYENGNVEKIVDILKEENVVGTFFVLKNTILKNQDLIKKILKNGNSVGNHTLTHKNLTGKSKEEFDAEVLGLEKLYKDTFGVEISKVFRPPEGTFDENMLKYAKEDGYKTIFWSFAYADWDNNKQMDKDKAKELVFNNIHNGEIMLLHPTSKTNTEIIRDVIRELKNQGFSFGKVEDLQ